MSNIHYVEQAKTLKENEVSEVICQKGYELELKKEEERAEALQSELRDLKRERDSCDMPSFEDIQNNDFKDYDKALELDKKIEQIQVEIEDSLKYQKHLLDEINNCRERIAAIKQSEQILLFELIQKIAVYERNLSEFEIDAVIYQSVIDHAATSIEQEIAVLNTAKDILESDIEQVVPGLREFLHQNDGTDFINNIKKILGVAGTVFFGLANLDKLVISKLATTMIKIAADEIKKDIVDENGHISLQDKVLLGFASLIPLSIVGISLSGTPYGTDFHIEHQPTWWEKTFDYVVRSADHLVFGHYSKYDATFLSIAADTILDIVSKGWAIGSATRDVIYDQTHLDSVSTEQIITDSIDFVGSGTELIKGMKMAETTSAAVKNMDEPIRYMANAVSDNAGEAIIRTVKNMDEPIIYHKGGKFIDEESELAEIAKKLPKASDNILSDGFDVKKFKNIQEYRIVNKMNSTEPAAFQQKKFWTTYEKRLKKTPSLNNPDLEWKNITERGECLCIPKDQSGDIAKILQSAGVDGIQYKNAVPDFSPVSIFDTKVSISDDFLKTHDIQSARPISYAQANKSFADYLNSNEQYAKNLGIKPDNGRYTAKCVESFMRDNKYTWHELNDCETLQCVPTLINQKFRHIGFWGEMSEKIK